MFDIGFFELLIIAVVGLLVIGPERLPSAIRTGALWFGRLKRSLTEARGELEKQIGADDIRRELHNEQIMHSLKTLRDAGHDFERQVNEAAREGATLEHDPSHRENRHRPEGDGPQDTVERPDSTPQTTETDSDPEPTRDDDRKRHD